MKLCADFIADIEGHIDAKNDIQQGDKEAWREWFDKLMMWSNLAGGMTERLQEQADSECQKDG